MRKRDEALERLARTLGQFSQLDLSERPVASLDVVDGDVVLGSVDARPIFEAVFRDRAVRPVRAFSLAPHPQIRSFDKKAFQVEGAYYSVRYEGAKITPQSEVYLRRFLKIEYAMAGVQPDQDRKKTRIEAGPAKGPALLLDPQPVPLSEEHANLLFSGDAGLLADLRDASFLPPVRTDEHQGVRESYFSDELVRLRWALAVRTGLDVMRQDEPAAVGIWRLMNDPLVRDVLLDGGSLHVRGSEGEPTRVELHLWPGGDAVSSYRSLALLTPERVPGPPWAQDLARVLRNDIESLIPEGLTIQKASAPVSWGTPQVRPYLPGAHEGTWTDLVTIKDRLGPNCERESVTFAERITEPARERLHVFDGKHSRIPADNDLAERLFILNAWRNPWSVETNTDAWRLAMVEMLTDELIGVHPTPEQRVKAWQEEDSSFRLVICSNAPPLLRYSGKATAEDMLRWRLLLPLGTVVRGRTLQLDVPDFSRLDSGFVLT